MFFSLSGKVRTYCEAQPRHKGKNWMDLFADHAFPHDGPEDAAKSKDWVG